MGQLHDRMAQDMVLRRFRPATQRNYLIYCRKFAAFYRRSPLDMGQEEIRTFLLHCLQVQKLSHETYRQIYAALKFLYSVTLKRTWEVEHIPFPRCWGSIETAKKPKSKREVIEVRQWQGSKGYQRRP